MKGRGGRGYKGKYQVKLLRVVYYFTAMYIYVCFKYPVFVLKDVKYGIK